MVPFLQRAHRLPILCLLALLSLPAANSLLGGGATRIFSVRASKCARATSTASHMQHGKSQGGEKRRDQADAAAARTSRAAMPIVDCNSPPLPPRTRAGGDGLVGGSDLRLVQGARRVTPAERVHLMGVPMQTGILRDSRDADGMRQKAMLQETVSAGDDWWAGDAVDLGDDANALPPDWIEEPMGQGRAPVYHNLVTGFKTRTRPKMPRTHTAEPARQGRGPLEDDLVNVAFVFEEERAQAEVGVQDGFAAEWARAPAISYPDSAVAGDSRAGEVQEAEEDTRTLVRRRMQMSSDGQGTTTLLRRCLHSQPDSSWLPIGPPAHGSNDGAPSKLSPQLARSSASSSVDNARPATTRTLMRSLLDKEVDLDALAPIQAISAEGEPEGDVLLPDTLRTQNLGPAASPASTGGLQGAMGMDAEQQMIDPELMRQMMTAAVSQKGRRVPDHLLPGKTVTPGERATASVSQSSNILKVSECVSKGEGQGEEGGEGEGEGEGEAAPSTTLASAAPKDAKDEGHEVLDDVLRVLFRHDIQVLHVDDTLIVLVLDLKYV